ncbi:MAG: DUF2569 family protein [Woeseiaceae bacterium]
MLLIVPIRFYLQVMISIEVTDDELAEIAVPGLFVSALMAVIWISYFALSPRVKAIVDGTDRVLKA